MGVDQDTWLSLAQYLLFQKCFLTKCFHLSSLILGLDNLKKKQFCFKILVFGILINSYKSLLTRIELV